MADPALVEILDLLSFLAQGQRNIMASITEVQANNKELMAIMNEHMADVKAIIADLGTAGASGHAAVLDGIVSDQKTAITAFKAMVTEIAEAANVEKAKLPGATS